MSDRRKSPPPDQAERQQALDPSKSILVQAPAGSGKTDLLTRRFLRLLTEIEDPGQIVAITFTKAAAAEMRHRILAKLEEAATSAGPASSEDAFSMEELARRALAHSRALGWNLLEQPARLRISTIDSFCRELALQQPLLSGLGDALDIFAQPDELYRRAARRTLQQIDSADAVLRTAIQDLLVWRDNNWQEMENLLVEMLKNRDRWMHGFVLEREPEEDALRARLERPFAKAVAAALTRLSRLLDWVPGAREEALALMRFACAHGARSMFQESTEFTDFPVGEFANADPAALEEACRAYKLLARLMLTGEGRFWKRVSIHLGFPADCTVEKDLLRALIARLSSVPGFESALAAVRELPPPRYTDQDWRIVRACFVLLRRAAAELRVVFAEAGGADYIEVAQIAMRVLQDDDGQPSEAAQAIANGIRHILVDEFQDTSRRQHELLRWLIAAWPERAGRTCFVVGDPMQSIYFFRDADAELFPRVKAAGLEIQGAETMRLTPVSLRSNFRTANPLVAKLNEIFEAVFEVDDGSGITFAPAEPARENEEPKVRTFELHLNFRPQPVRNAAHPDGDDKNDGQTAEIVSLVRKHLQRIKEARAKGGKYRVAVLGRTRAVLAPIAEALREASIPFRAVELERLSARPEVLDALSLARALLNPLDRVAWLGVLRAPWCGLTLSDLHRVASADDPDLLDRPVPELLAERLSMLSAEGRIAAQRVLDVLATAPAMRFAHPATSLATWLEQVWLRLGGGQCVDPAARVNLDLLWRTLDALPNGEQDLLGPALEAALADLTAQPDPAVDTNCGVQLMTIHKSKGLEFEVVIVPELQAGTRKTQIRMLSWLERGLPVEVAEPIDGASEVTEFLIAPLQSKGEDRGGAKTWVDRVYREREAQEMRRLLYVAATRAREQLHLFAQPTCKQSKDGGWELAESKGTLLATAWPGLREEIGRRFAQWIARDAEPAVIETIAAQGNLFEMPAQTKPNLIRRLPIDFQIKLREGIRRTQVEAAIVGDSDVLYQRHEGGLVPRALGTAVHRLLEEFARLRQTQDWDAAYGALKALQPRVAAQIRAAGATPQQAARLAAEAVEIASRASADAIGQWILAPREEAESEVRWAEADGGTLRTVQVDRVFRAGAEPYSERGNVWWIVDYKTALTDTRNSVEDLARLRAIFAPQLETYAGVLRKLRGDEIQIRAGLYYPRMLKFDWWEL